jgi:hypothetical protein
MTGEISKSVPYRGEQIENDGKFFNDRGLTKGIRYKKGANADFSLASK